MEGKGFEVKRPEKSFRKIPSTITIEYNDGTKDTYTDFFTSRIEVSAEYSQYNSLEISAKYWHEKSEPKSKVHAKGTVNVAKVTNKLLGRSFVFRGRNSRTLERSKIEADSQWDTLASEMPFLRFPKEWEVSIIPPFAGASCRFLARLRGETEQVSVYFDSEDALGSCQKPYWEAYSIDGDTERFLEGEEAKMISVIDKELKNRRKK